MIRSLSFTAVCLLAGGASASCIDLAASGSPDAPRKVQLPDMAYLATTAIEGGGGSYAITSYPLLPDGGIGGEHLCGIVTEVPFAGGEPLTEGMVQRLSLQLRQEVDYGGAYPAFYDRVVASGQLHLAPGGIYSAHAFPDGASPGSDDLAFQRLLPAGCSGTAIVAGDTVLVPDC